ncbi:MAG: glycine--tRNA ligase subunit beta [Mariprofundaceae bacterium]
MSDQQPLLIEIGVEEIPAGVAPRMGDALKAGLNKLLADANVEMSNLKLGVTPRRLLIHVESCQVMQADREQVIWGPPEKVALQDGEPSKAAEGFARKSGLNVADFEFTDKGDGKAKYMRAVITVKGRKIVDIIAEAMPALLRSLPSPKQMQWQDGESRTDAFIRPIRWMVARLGDEIIPFTFAGIQTDKASYGHRMCKDAKGEICVNDPFAWLNERMVVADRDLRKVMIQEGLAAAAKEAGVLLVEDVDLVDEVTDLTEWPSVITGHYLEDFLRLPIEVSRIELKHHQRCFSSQDDKGKTLNVFFAIANIKSKNPGLVAHGNERVVNARLADATFFYDRDPKESLEERVEKLSGIVFQDGLGMVGDQVRRLRGFILDTASQLGVEANDAQRAAYLCKSDLTTGLVGEFPELQGYMGGVYAHVDGENNAVATAIEQHYAPVGADDAVPESAIAKAIGVIERADKLLGYFHLGKIPTASADPFALRRAAIGLIHLLEDKVNPIEMTLSDVLKEAIKQWNQQRVTIAISAETQQAVSHFVFERLLGMADGFMVSRSAMDAALHANVELPLYKHLAVAELLTKFADSEAGQAVASANKRIANILKKTGDISGDVNPELFAENAELALFSALQVVEADFPQDPAVQLDVLASLREPVDTFFDDVMVMADDAAIKNNRLVLLARLRTLFLRLADVSRL